MKLYAPRCVEGWVFGQRRARVRFSRAACAQVRPTKRPEIIEQLVGEK